MTTSTKIHIAAYTLLAAGVITFAAFWIQDAIAHARAQAKVEAQQQVMDATDKQMKDRADTFKAEIEVLKQSIEKVKTPDQAIRYIHDNVPALASVQQAKDLPVSLPDAPTPQGMRRVMVHDDDAIVPSAKLIESAELVNRCQQDTKGFLKCQQDVGDTQTKLDLAIKQRDEWKSAAKGGSKWHRFGKALKVVACAGGGAAAGSLSSQKQMGAAIGAAAGAGICSIL